MKTIEQALQESDRQTVAAIESILEAEDDQALRLAAFELTASLNTFNLIKTYGGTNERHH